MASLLDFIIQNRMPQGGLLGQNQTPPEANPLAALSAAGPSPSAPPSGGGGGINGDAISRLFAGGTDPSLSQEENDSIKRQAILMAGLGTLASDPSKGTAGRLAEGIATGQMVSEQARERAAEARERTAEARRKIMIGDALTGEEPGIARADAERALQFAIASGDNDAAKNIIDVLGTLPEDTRHKPETVKLADGTVAIFDPNDRLFYDASGQEITELPEDAADEDDRLQFTDNLVDPATGEPVAGVINLDRGTFTHVDGVVPADSMETQDLGPDQIETAEQATLMRKNFDVMKAYWEENQSIPSAIDLKRFESDGTLFAASGGRDLPNDVQQFLQAQEAILLELANKLAGVRGISAENARGAIRRAFGFTQGDSPGNINQTLQDIEIRVRSMELQAGSALSLFRDISGGEEEENPFEGI